MDLRRVKNPEKLMMCRRYYLAGFFVLPFLWLVNGIWFFKEAFRKPPYTEQAQIRSYVIRSLIGSAVWLAIIITWVIIFQLKRVSWGVTGEMFTFILPSGSA
ncbi:gamma-secretase subunit pen-2 [Plakobranchus ocellatus]|uniref:Gamma-secretase subunit PEN-2 n=1 Tax=Plakobranchus ocellatus TaxID=259542 RepID=A0AAV3YQF9_9GAST|nr:gamma-secretase subunit pen-2 [Plakobranchus ocellatus]